MCLLLLSLKKTPLLEITFVDTGFVLLFAILAVAEEMEHFLFLILGKILSPEISRLYSLPGQVLEPHFNPERDSVLREKEIVWNRKGQNRIVNRWNMEHLQTENGTSLGQQIKLL